jgi:superfamily II RNA helicase
MLNFRSFRRRPNTGILTGDRKENADAPVIVGTTEILRNQLYDAMHRGETWIPISWFWTKPTFWGTRTAAWSGKKP